MPDEIKTYNSMAEFYASIGGKLEQDVDFTIHRLEQVHGEVPVKSPLFRTNYYSIVLIRQGKGCYIIDGQSYGTKDQTIYFTNPGHIKGFEIEELAHGYIVTFSEAFLKQSVHADIFDEFPFLIAEVAPPHYPEADLFGEFDKLGDQLMGEFRSSSTYKFNVIGSLTVILLLRIKEHYLDCGENYRRSPSAAVSQFAIGAGNRLSTRLQRCRSLFPLFQETHGAIARLLDQDCQRMMKAAISGTSSNFIMEKRVAQLSSWFSIGGWPCLLYFRL